LGDSTFQSTWITQTEPIWATCKDRGGSDVTDERCGNRPKGAALRVGAGEALGLRRVACPRNPSACTTLLAEKLPAPIRVNEVGRKGPMGAGGEPLLPARSAGAGLSCRARGPCPSAPGAAAGTRPCPCGRCCP